MCRTPDTIGCSQTRRLPFERPIPLSRRCLSCH
jgi:hypothetical protein